MAFWWEMSEENGETGSSWHGDCSSSHEYSLQLWWAEKHVQMHSMPNLKADGIQQQKYTLGSTVIGQEQLSEDIFDRATPKRTGKRPRPVTQ